MSNLTLYTTTAVLILDNEGQRILAKYYAPPHAPKPIPPSANHNNGSNAQQPPPPQPPAAAAAKAAAHQQLGASAASTPQLYTPNVFATLKEQRSFEKAITEKTRRASGDIILYDSHLVLFKPCLDCTLYVVSPAQENELMLASVLSSLYEALGLLLHHHASLDKRSLLENLDLVTLAVDETVDDGIILELDPTTISSRVSRPRPDVQELQINEQTLLNAYANLKERVAQRILSGGL